MQRRYSSVQDVIDLLNELNRMDGDVVSALVNTRYRCNDAVVRHPTVQVDSSEGSPRLGFVGLLNGLFGVDEGGYGPLTAVMDARNKVVRFQRTPSPEERRRAWEQKRRRDAERAARTAALQRRD